MTPTAHQNLLAGKKIVLGISGGIAAYKCPEIVRRLKDGGAEIKVIMTHAAQSFITPMTLQAVSANPVSSDLLDPAAEAAMGHIEIGKWADLILIAPATADVLARLAAGMADDLLTTVCLASEAPIAVAPAMNQQMFRAAATQNNLKKLASRGVHIWGPASGSQACGDVGLGRMLEPLDLVALVHDHFNRSCDLSGLNILLTAGPTREALDPVRFITNHSSGKMGFAIAQAAAARGAYVTLITGPVTLPTPSRVQRIDVTTALEMQQAVQTIINKQHIFIACAAVADYRPLEIAVEKIKKQQHEITIKMVKNPDIVAGVASMTENRPFVVGFAAETQDIEKHARQKLLHKKLDLICANDVSCIDQGFNSDINALHLYWHDGEIFLPSCEKSKLGQHVISEIIHRYDEKNRR